MFNCSICGSEGIGPKVKPVKVVTGIRHVEYHNEYIVEDEWGNKEKREVDSIGTEITGEALACPECAQQEARKPASVERKGIRSFQEKPADPMRVKLIACVVHTGLDRLGHNTKRAQQDGKVLVPNIKAFTDKNKDFVF